MPALVSRPSRLQLAPDRVVAGIDPGRSLQMLDGAGPVALRGAKPSQREPALGVVRDADLEAVAGMARVSLRPK